MYHVTTQGVDERMINEHYYYHCRQECTWSDLHTKQHFGEVSFQLLLACNRTQHVTLRHDAAHARPSFVKGLPGLRYTETTFQSAIKLGKL